MNIVELILKLLGGDTLKQLSAFTGESPDLVQKALGAIVPTLLSGIGGAAAKPNGAEKLFNSLRSIDDSLSDNLGSVIAKGGADELAKKGTNILGDLLGGGALTALIGPLAKFLAGNTALVSKLLPMIAPFALSVLSKQVKSGGLDAAGLLKMLLSQKSNIARAIPGDLAKGLAGVQGLSDLANFASDTAATVGHTASKVGQAGKEVAKESTNWFLPLLALAALIGGLLWWLSQSKPPVKENNAPPMTGKMIERAEEMAAEVKDKVEATLDPVKALTEDFTGYFKSIDGALDGITDVDTAKAAVPNLEKLVGQFDGLSALFSKLPAAGRGGVLSLLEGGEKTLQEKAEKAIGIPGVGELIKPLLDGLLQKLSALIKG
jgi:hypothetical protein